LQLTEYAARAEQGEGDPDDRGKCALAGRGSGPRDVLDHLDRTFVEKVTHLLGKLAPSARSIVAENYSNDRKQEQDERCEREHGVVGQRRAQLRRLIA